VIAPSCAARRKPIEKIGLSEIARAAGVSLSELRGCFAPRLRSRGADEGTDRAVLAAEDADMAEEPARERLSTC